MRDKKGLEMAFGTIVVIVLAVLILAFLAFMLSRSFGTFKDRVWGYFSSSNVDGFIEKCNSLVELNGKYEYCCEKKEVKINSKEKYQLSCSESIGKSWAKDLNLLECVGVCAA